VEIDKAVATNNKFMTSLAFWSFLVEKSILPDATFIQPAPHILFVHGEEKREWLKRRVEKLSKLPAFAATEYSEDYDTIQKWSGLLCNGRPRSGGEVIAASRHPDGTEVNYGLLTRHLVQSFGELGGDVQLLSTVTAPMASFRAADRYSCPFVVYYFQHHRRRHHHLMTTRTHLWV
jgi:malate dehydrogenase (quinone)